MLMWAAGAMRCRCGSWSSRTQLAATGPWALEGIAGDVKEAIGRVSDGPFDAEQNANIPTVNYEAGSRTRPLLSAWFISRICCRMR